MSPFAVIDHASVVHGRLMWEGKLIAAAVKASIGVRLRYDYSGQGEKRKVVVSGEIEGQTETIEGTVADWKTTGKNSPWDNLANRDQMLAYRGARQWARRHAPEVILGVYTPDEFNEEDLRDVTPPKTQARSHVEPIAGFQSPTPEVTPASAKSETPQDTGVDGTSKSVDIPESGSTAETIPPQGRQTKQRYKDVITLLDISDARESKGKTWWSAEIQTPKGQTVEVNTFSSSMVERLGGHIGDKLEVTFTKTPKGGFVLEDFDLAEGGSEEVA